MDRSVLFSLLAVAYTAHLAPPHRTASSAPAVRSATAVRHMEWQIDGDTRRAIVHVPAAARTINSPVVFAFHGHGGTARHAARTMAFQREWPEALCVYMQGLPTPGMTDPQGRQNGWQRSPGDQRDRDLKFFDAILKSLKREYKVDSHRIYATGHSNGGAFTYLLWAERGEHLAAVAPSAAGTRMRSLLALQPKPAMHIAGERDSLVPFAFQVRTMRFIRELNGCEDEGQPWAKRGDLAGMLYPSRRGAPFVSLIYPGTHTFPSDAPELIVRFFRQHQRPRDPL